MFALRFDLDNLFWVKFANFKIHDKVVKSDIWNVKKIQLAVLSFCDFYLNSAVSC